MITAYRVVLWCGTTHHLLKHHLLTHRLPHFTYSFLVSWFNHLAKMPLSFGKIRFERLFELCYPASSVHMEQYDERHFIPTE